MGGRAKGLLAAPDGTGNLVERLARTARRAMPGAEILLVGDTSEYEEVPIASLTDEPAGIGPLGGLCALLSGALDRRVDAVALACDLPHVSDELLQKLAGAAPGAPAVAPRPDGIWQPLFARYSAVPSLAAALATIDAGERALHRVLGRVDTHVLDLDDAELRTLRDWDCPEDQKRDGVPPRET